MTTLKHYHNPDEIEERAKDNKRVDLKYIGPLAHLANKKGLGYFIVAENKWYFQPNGSEDTYRINSENLDFET